MVTTSLRALARALLLSILAAVAQAQSSDFTIIVLPDTQNEAQYYPNVMASQTQWIVANQSALNIQAVLGVGDIVNDGASDAQQQNADAAIKLLDNAGIPYLMAIGNHDYDGALMSGLGRSVTGFNNWWGPNRYAGKSYYQGNYPSGSNENFYSVLNIGGTNYLFLMLEFVPRNAALDWAESVLNANPDKSVILVTHSYMYVDGTRADRCDTNDMNNDNDGDEMWARLRKHANLMMTLNGHLTNGFASRRADMGDNGNLVNEVFANYQDLANGGDGWLRVMTFHPSMNTITIRTYSPFLNAYKTDSSNQFTLNMQRVITNTGAGTMSGKVRDTVTCQPLAGATVSTQGASTITDSNGRYTLSLPVGSNTLTASVSGYNSATATDNVADSFDTNVNLYLSAVAGPAPCTLNTASPSVTICTPSSNAMVTSPVQVAAGTTGSNTVSMIQIYVDGTAAYTTLGGTLNTSLAISSGTHRLTVQAKDSSGYFKQTESITVGPASTGGGGGGTGSCTPGAAPSVTICSPAANASVSSPVTVTAAVADSNPVSFTQVYVDGIGVYTVNSANVDTLLSMAAGTHRLTVQAKDSMGTYIKLTESVMVGSTSTGGGGGGSTGGTGTCTLGPSPSVTICPPTSGSSVSSPVSIIAGVSDTNPVSYTQVYVDGVASYTVKSATVNTSLAMSTGIHRVTVQAKDSAGLILKQTINVTVQ
jgi:hypothetical protein